VGDGANIGLRAKNFPGLDIDSLHEGIAQEVEQLALGVLGPAPVRIGRAPKRLLMYRTDAPFARMRIRLERDGTSHLIELLGDGQQYLVAGIHPGTMQPYTWLQELPPADQLTPIGPAQVEGLFARIKEVFEVQGYRVQREGTGRRREPANATHQADLRAPSIEALREAVGCIPNAHDQFPTRDDYIKVGYAIRAAAGDDLEAGLEIYSDWCSRWDGGVNPPETVLADWERMEPPYSLGWSWLAGLARPHGFNDAALDFEAAGPRPEATQPLPPPVEFSEQHLADVFLSEHGERLRAVPLWETWLLWDGARWARDERRCVQALARDTLRRIADGVARMGSTAKERREALRMARSISSAQKVKNILALAGVEPSVVVKPDMLDADPWVLNTPNGLLDLKTGQVGPHDRNMLLTKITNVHVDATGDCPRWIAFLGEATGGDAEFARYLQRLAGYCLTGSVREHAIAFIHGPGGNGKTVFLETLAFVLGDYATQSSMTTFMASSFQQHPTEIAALRGARLVTASETDEGGRWNEARLKSLTGSDRVTARFLFEDFFEFQPQFKLLLVGNHKPQLRNVDEAMRRRLHLIPFITRPAQPDRDLLEKLRTEAPAILAWMIKGCIAWQADGLAAAPVVRDATAEYFSDEDAMGRWLDEACEVSVDATATTKDLYAGWREWCGEAGEFVGSERRFAHMLINQGFERWRESHTRRMGFRGLKPVPWSNAPLPSPKPPEGTSGARVGL